jgi:hypothetical protein
VASHISPYDSLARVIKDYFGLSSYCGGERMKALLTKKDYSAIAKAPGARFSTLPQLKKFRDGDASVRGAMMKAQRQRRLRWIRAGAGVEEEET